MLLSPERIKKSRGPGSEERSARAIFRCYHGDQVVDRKMADSVQIEDAQRRPVGGSITTGRIHKGKGFDIQLNI